uniref:Uncharacterized protein n=1 Tax=Talaromyces marneffei PM1 TaxID=1077442 RepID=A0A093VK78_TALMA
MQLLALVALLPMAFVAAAPTSVEERQVASGCYPLFVISSSHLFSPLYTDRKSITARIQIVALTMLYANAQTTRAMATTATRHGAFLRQVKRNWEATLAKQYLHWACYQHNLNQSLLGFQYLKARI